MRNALADAEVRGRVSGVPPGRGVIYAHPPGVGNAGLLSDSPSGTCVRGSRPIFRPKKRAQRPRGPGGIIENSPPVELAGLRNPRKTTVSRRAIVGRSLRDLRRWRSVNRFRFTHQIKGREETKTSPKGSRLSDAPVPGYAPVPEGRLKIARQFHWRDCATQEKQPCPVGTPEPTRDLGT